MWRTASRKNTRLLCWAAVAVTLAVPRAGAADGAIVSVRAGNASSFALASDGTVWSWGANGAASLGDGTLINRYTPVRVIDPSDASGLLTGVVSISAHFSGHALALKADGSVWSWGANGTGELGDGTRTPRPFAARVLGLPEIAAVEAAGGYSLAIDRVGRVWAWGANEQGQLGRGTTVTPGFAPVLVSGLPAEHPVTAVAGEAAHSMALTSAGTVYGWGRNSVGQVGDGTVNNIRSVATQVKDPSDASGLLQNVAAVAAGQAASYALDRNGTVKAWGFNPNGQLGDGTLASSAVPVSVLKHPGGPRFDRVTALSGGNLFVAARRADGTVWCWGTNNSAQLGDGTTTMSSSPVQVVDPHHPKGFLKGISEVAAGGTYMIALKDDGGVQVWGSKGTGQLGIGEAAIRTLPVQVIDPTDPTGMLQGVAAITAGGATAFAMTPGGQARAWGDNGFGGLGDGTTISRLAPVWVLDPGDPSGRLSGIASLRSSGNHVLAIKTSSALVSFGLGTVGQVGDGANSTRFFPVTLGLTGATSIWPTGNSSLAIAAPNGTVYGFGFNGTGQLGNGNTLNQSLPVAALDPTGTATLTGAVSVAGAGHGLARMGDDTVLGWGANQVGQLGRGTFTSTPQLRAAPIPGLTDVKQLVSGGNYGVALKGDTTVWTWGVNSVGQLGVGSNVGPQSCNGVACSMSPVQVMASPGVPLSGVLAVSALGGHVLALMSDHTVLGWGTNDSGQLGDGTTDFRATPVPVLNPAGTAPLAGVIAIAAGGAYSLALMSDLTVRAWGAAAAGQVGDGVSGNVFTPVKVQFP